jgi:ubiquinone/menaquinone biosynthesis C-methylase UbiE
MLQDNTEWLLRSCNPFAGLKTGHYICSCEYGKLLWQPLYPMNSFEHALCSSSLWRYVSQKRLLPWLLAGSRLGDHVLEIGAGYGAATGELRTRADRVTSLEYDPASLAKLKAKLNGGACSPVCGDAAILPFADQSFSSATAILVLHHLKSEELQDRAFAETFRVLGAGGIFLAFEINDSWIHHVAHIKSTFTPVAPGSAFARLTKAGFSRVSVDFRVGGFRISATRPKDDLESAS